MLVRRGVCVVVVVEVLAVLVKVDIPPGRQVRLVGLLGDPEVLLFICETSQPASQSESRERGRESRCDTWAYANERGEHEDVVRLILGHDVRSIVGNVAHPTRPCHSPGSPGSTTEVELRGGCLAPSELVLPSPPLFLQVHLRGSLLKTPSPLTRIEPPPLLQSFPPGASASPRRRLSLPLQSGGSDMLSC